MKLIYVTSIFFSLISFSLYKLFSHRYLSNLPSVFYLLSTVIPIIFFLHKAVFTNFTGKHQIKPFLFLIFLTIFFHSLNLEKYPFVSIGDEIRDGGLDAFSIENNLSTDIFSYGRYNAHSLIIPGFNSLFIPIFGNSNLTYRFPSALIGSLSVIILYLFLSLNINYKVAFWSSFFLLTNHLHLFYSRTETVVIFNSLLTVLLIIFFYLYFLKKSLSDTYLYILAILIGFCFNFHASIKTVALTIIPLIIFNLYVHKYSFFDSIKKILTMGLFIVIGFGPTILNSPPHIFLHTTRISNELNLTRLTSSFLQSLKVVAFSPTTSHYFDHKPILSPIFLICFLIGLAYLSYKKFYQTYPLIYFLLVIPFFNSAVTDMVNADHRLLPLLLILSIYIGVGINIIISKFKKNVVKITVSVIFFVYLSYHGITFFTKQKANINDYNNLRQEKDYLSMHLIYLLKNNIKFFPNNLCVLASPYNSQNYNYLHYQEQRQYFLPNYQIRFESNHNVSDNQLFIYQDNCPQTVDYAHLGSQHVDCSYQENKLFCPIGFKDKLSIYF